MTRKQWLDAYISYMAVRLALLPPQDATALLDQLRDDCIAIHKIMTLCYLNPRPEVPKIANLSVAWEYTADPAHHDRFTDMLRVSPHVFETILEKIRRHGIFKSRSDRKQVDPRIQFAVILFRMGHYGNGASVREIARWAGIAEGSVETYTNRCMEALTL
ncbi:hypothetical protein PENSPDRAFT_589365 [Peniophora sp. CONT]|nr:hypothetical protein PENSPDRAFT_589365 [Peniophora sp. CONT]